MSEQPDFNNDNHERHDVVAGGTTHLPSTYVRETMPSMQEEEIHLRDYLDVIMRRKWVVLVTILITFSTVAFFTFSKTPLFLSTGMIKTTPTARNITSFQTMDDSFMKSQEYISTQVKLLQSESLLSQLIAEMDLKNNDLFTGAGDETASQGLFSGARKVLSTTKDMIRDIIRPQVESQASVMMNQEAMDRIALEQYLEKIRSALKVTPVKDTQLIEISIENANSRLGADMVNNLMDLFLQTSMQSQLDVLQSAEMFLDKQIAAAKIKLEKSEKELNEFARRTGIISLDSRLNLIMRELEEVNDALSQAVTVRIAREAVYRQAMKEGADSLPAVMNNELIQELKKQHNELQAEYQQLSTVFKDEYPKVKKLKARMSELESNYDRELQRIVNSIRIEYESALGNEEQLKQKAEQQKQLAIELNDRATQYKILDREVVSNKEVYNSLLTRSKEIAATVGSDAGHIEIIDWARPPLNPYKPNVRRSLLLGILLGSFGGIGLAFLLEYMDNTIKNPDEFSRRYRIPVLGLIPFKDQISEESRELPFIVYTDPKAPISEAIRTTMFSIELSTSEVPPKIMLVTSVLPDVGKSTLATNFSLSLLSSNARVLLIDTDLRKPTLHKIFDIEDNSSGLSSFLAGSVKLEDIVRKTKYENLYFIPSGPIPPNPPELLASSRMRKFIASAAGKFDYIIIDAPPFHGFAEILILSSMVDGVILISELNKTPRDGIEYFKKAVSNVGGRILGVLINKAGKGGNGYRYYGGYSYQYRYQYKYGSESK
ncbi:MAG: polysaccharide biosynthesis tyrosine autokinase [Desulfobulbaceae bacterium]|nr:polysaccharide biosynthesis tyrosine autokinase [Desulfobulbaceae bacterium]